MDKPTFPAAPGQPGNMSGFCIASVRLHSLWPVLGLAVLLFGVGGALFPAPAGAVGQTARPAEINDTVATLLPPVMVKAQREPLTTASKTIDRAAIESFPFGNGSINEILSVLPDIQFSETSNLSTRGGEILPPEVSISGGRGFENNFVIDGLGNNSLLDPDADNPVDNNSVPGHAQEIFLDASLVDQVTVYDSNVPASYGDFKGGVVHATTIQPDFEFGGNLFYRTTRDAWTQLHVAREDRVAFENSKDHNRQPKFEKHHAGGDIHLPLAPRLRLLASYRLLLSTIPLQHIGESRNQHRRQETFMAKLACTPSHLSELDLSWTYSPYRGHYFKKDFRNSDFTNLGGAYQLNADYRHALAFGDLHLQAGFRESENSREGPDHMYQTQNPDGSWDKEGFTGDIEKSQQTFQWKTDLALHPLTTGPLSHALNLGLDFQHIRGISERAATSYLYTYLNSGVARRTVYEQYRAKAIVRQYNLYAEDILRFRRLELRPGLRLSYDDFMKNMNLAPRLAAALDIFGNGRTVLIGGVNRYYASPLLTYKLREGTPGSYMEQWSEQDGWTLRSASVSANRYSALKTPYADEYVLGLEQRIFGGKATFKYVRRNGQDEFAKTWDDERPDGINYYWLNNNGYSRHDSYRLSWERQWRQHTLNINATWQETTSSNESYDDLLNDDDLDEEVWYDGGVVRKSRLPRTDFNRSWLANLLYVGRLPYDLTFSGMLRYRSGYETYRTSGEQHEDLGIPIYEKTSHGGAVTVNCKLDWRARPWSGQELILSLEILNLLDKQSAVGEAEGDYELGRQFWLGAKYAF